MENTYSNNEQYETAAVYEQPVYTPPVQDESTKPAGTGSFFGLMLLLWLPIIGFISCIITIFAAKNKSIKNFAKATLIWQIIGLVILALVIAAIAALLNFVAVLVSEALVDMGILESLNGITDLSSLINALQNGAFNPDFFGGLLGQLSGLNIDPGMLGQLISQMDVQQLGELLSKLETSQLKELFSGLDPSQVETLIGQLQSGDIDTALLEDMISQVEPDKLVGIISQIDPGELGGFISQLDPDQFGDVGNIGGDIVGGIVDQIPSVDITLPAA